MEHLIEISIILISIIFVYFILVYYPMYMIIEISRQMIRKQKQKILLKQDRLQDILVLIGLRETMEYRRSSFKYRQYY